MSLMAVRHSDTRMRNIGIKHIVVNYAVSEDGSEHRNLLIHTDTEPISSFLSNLSTQLRS